MIALLQLPLGGGASSPAPRLPHRGVRVLASPTSSAPLDPSALRRALVRPPQFSAAAVTGGFTTRSVGSLRHTAVGPERPELFEALADAAGLPGAPWALAHQVHGTRVVTVAGGGRVPDCDGAGMVAGLTGRWDAPYVPCHGRRR